jgi:hypothetical protein
VEPPVSLGISEDGIPLTTDDKIEIAADIGEVSLTAGSVPVGAVAQPVLAPLTKAEILALVARRLRSYLQTMVWDIPMDETEHLSERSVTLTSLDPAKAMSPREETTLDVETELLLKTKD